MAVRLYDEYDRDSVRGGTWAKSIPDQKGDVGCIDVLMVGSGRVLEAYRLGPVGHVLMHPRGARLRG